MGRTLAERIRSHEQQKARLAVREAELKEATRKARIRRLIQVGELVEKAELLDLDSTALSGALLTIKTDAGDPEIVARWSALGGSTFARAASVEDQGKELIIITFRAPVLRYVASALQSAGLRFNNQLERWEGRAHFAKAEALANSYGGTITRVASSETKHPGANLAAAAE